MTLPKELRDRLVKADTIDEPDFVSDGERSWCQHCGVLKKDTAQFFKDHARECVEPRRKERHGQD